MKEQTNPFSYLANLIDPGQYTERPTRTLQPGDTDIIQPIKRNPFYGIPADLLQAAHNLTIRNPNEMTGAEVLSQMAGIPSLAKTLDRLSGGFQLHSGSGQAIQMLPETRDALLAVAPFAIKPAATAARAAENATVGALQRARIARAAEQARRTPEAVYNPLRERLENQGSLQFAVKPKGGNWAPSINLDLPSKRLAGSATELKPDSVTRALSPLRTYYQGPNLTAAEVDSLNANVAEPLNRWLDKKLTPYVRNEMGTPDDPIRLMHEQGYSHSPALRNLDENFGGTWLPQRTFDARSEAGFPEEGFAVRKHAEAGYPEENSLNTRRAEEWETISDRAIDPNIAGNYQEDIQLGRQRLVKPEYKSILGDWDPNVEMAEKNPWIEKLDPSTPIYRIAEPEAFSFDLDFNHLMDELRASLSPNSELPAHLRLTPETLNKVSVGDAVKRVSEINDWRALEAAKAEQAGMLENLSSNARLVDPTAQLSFVEKPGLTWADIPEVIDEKGTKLCTSIGKAGGWCTMNANTAQQYGAGQNRLVALLDAEGRPHAQAMIVESTKRPYDLWYEQNPHRSPENNAFMEWLEAKRAETGDKKMNTGQNYIEWAKETGRTIPTQAVPDIAELKPPGNAFSSGRAKAYEKRDPDYQKKVSESVAKFLNSGEWGRVNDLYHYGIFDLRDPSSYGSLTKLFGEEGADKVFAATRANGGTPPVRFMTRDQVKDFISPPVEGYAEGGTVKSDFMIDPSSYAQSRAKQMFPKQKSEWTQQDAARHMLASGMMTQKFGPTVAKIAGLAHEHGNAPIKTIGYALGIGKMPPDYDQDLHNNALGVQLAKEATSQEDLESRIQAILGKATKQPVPGQPWIGRPANIPNQMSDYATGGRVNPHSTNPFDHLV